MLRRPSIPSILRFWRWGLLAALATVLALAAAHDSASPAIAAGAGTQFSIAAVSGPGLKDPCDTSTTDRSCLIHPGASFVVRVRLDELGSLPDADGDTVSGYIEPQVGLDYSPGLVLNYGGEIVWQTPDCGQKIFHLEGWFASQCFTNDESTYTGTMVELSFTCSPSRSTETISLLFAGDNARTVLNLDYPYSFVTDDQPTETLVINCDYHFPWDVDADDAVSAQDIFETIAHFGQNPGQ